MILKNVKYCPCTIALDPSNTLWLLREKCCSKNVRAFGSLIFKTKCEWRIIYASQTQNALQINLASNSKFTFKNQTKNSKFWRAHILAVVKTEIEKTLLIYFEKNERSNVSTDLERRFNPGASTKSTSILWIRGQPARFCCSRCLYASLNFYP